MSRVKDCNGRTLAPCELKICGIIDCKAAAASKRKNVGLLRRPINRDAKMRKPVQNRCSVALRQASSALAHDACVAHFEPP
jgi:hypothetical protein